MLFSSPVFLFLFLPIVLSIYFVIKKELQNLFLLLASLLFYFWSENFFIKVLLAYIFFNYIAGLVLAVVKKPLYKKYVVGIAISMNLMPLIYFKYSPFLTENLNGALGFFKGPSLFVHSVYLPLGISFITFHAISYIVDVYRQKVVQQRDLVKFGLYMALFPQLIAGPIIRYHNIAHQLSVRLIKEQDFLYGVQRFIIGLAKKMLIANSLGQVADAIFSLPPADLQGPQAWLGAISYMLQIYYDFSGYSDMAIGLGRLFGFTILENFNYPYVSRSVREFWRRWHISLSNWFRDYLYVPLGGNRGPQARTFLNLLIVFFLCGLWHGAQWTFIVWGLYHGAFLILERTVIGRALEKAPVLLQHVYTLIVVLMGWVIFRVESLSEAVIFLKTMFGFSSGNHGASPIGLYLNQLTLMVLFMGALGSMPIKQFVHRKIGAWQTRSRSLILVAGPLKFLFVSTIFMMSIMQLAGSTYNPFIYFRF